MALPRALVGLAGVDPALLEVELSLSSVLTYLHINTQVRPTPGAHMYLFGAASRGMQ
jgi:hypothetical protein